MVGTGGNAGNGGKPRLIGTEVCRLVLTPTSKYNWLFIFQEAAVMIVTVSLIVGGILAVLGYFAKKYGKCKWLAACISSRDQVDVERQKSQRKKWRIEFL